MRAVALLVPAAFALIACRAIFSYDTGVRRSVNGAQEWFFSPTGGSPLLVLGVSALLLYGRWRELKACFRTQRSSPLAWLALVPAAALALWAHYVSTPDLLIRSLSLMVLGFALLLGGTRGLRIVLLPALFLSFAVPLPAVLANQVIYPLQLATARSAAFVVSLFGGSPVRNGDLIELSGEIFQVIESCSGVRSIETLTMAAVLYATLFYRNPLCSVILVMSAPLIGYAINVGRVLSIMLNPYSLLSAVHTAQGVLMLVVGVLAIAAWDSVLGRWLNWPVRDRSLRLQSDGGAIDGVAAAPVLALSSLFAALALATLLLAPWAPPTSEAQTIHNLPRKLGGWTSNALKLDVKFMGSVGFSEQIYRLFDLGAQEVTLFLGVDDRLERRFSPLSGKTALPGPGWDVEEHRRVALEPDGLVADFLVLRSKRGRVLSLRWYEGVESLPVETLRSVLALDRGPLRRPGRALVARLVTSIGPSSSGFDDAVDRLYEFVPLVRDGLLRLGSSRHAMTGG